MKNKCLTILIGSFLATALSLSSANAFSFGFVNTPVGNPSVPGSPTVGISAVDIGQSFTMNWFLANPNALGEDLEAQGVFTVDAFNSTQLDLTIKLTNNTSNSVQAALMSLGIGVSPDAIPSSLQDGVVFDGFGSGSGAQQTFPGGFKGIDFCAFAANGCSGGNVNQGLQSGGFMDTFKVRLTGTYAGSATLASFGVKWQTSVGSFEIPSSQCTLNDPTCGGGIPTPEPGTLFLMGSGLAGLGLWRWKTKK